jgi:hypothetical protein
MISRIYILTNPVLINDTIGFYTCLQFDKARLIIFFLKVIRNPASKSLQSIEISLYLAFTIEWNVAKKEKLLMNYLIYLEILFFWGKVN